MAHRLPDKTIRERLMKKTVRDAGCLVKPNCEHYWNMWDGSKVDYAHRLAFEVWKGPITQPLVRHTCNRKSCVDPTHLLQGNKSQNALDAVHDFGEWLGERNPMAFLTQQEVATIRSLVAEGSTQTSVAKRFNVDRSHVSRIVRGERW